MAEKALNAWSIRKRRGLETREIGQLWCPGVHPGTRVVWKWEERTGRQKDKEAALNGWKESLFWTLCISQKVASLHSHLLTYLTGAKSSRKWRKCCSFPIMWDGGLWDTPALLIPKEIQDDSTSHQTKRWWQDSLPLIEPSVSTASRMQKSQDEKKHECVPPLNGDSA